MSLISQTISGLYNGVSQQAPPIRHDNQCQAMDNAYPTVVRGLSMRPPTQHISKLSATPYSTNSLVHFIHEDATEKYALVFKPDQTVEAFNLNTGAAITYTVGSGTAYLPTNPKQDLAVMTVADYTFVVNKAMTVYMTADVAPGTLGTAYQSLQALNDDTGNPAGVVPPSGEHEITGDGQSLNDSFYVQGDGQTWREIPKPGISTTLDPARMPHALINYGGTSFTLNPLSWDLRKAGDDDTNTLPSFVGATLDDVFFYRNRLGFTADENVILSESGEFFNFFRKTVTQLLDTAPIDVSASHNKVSLLKYAVPYNKSLYLFSPQAQFVMDSSGVLTPRSAGLDQTTEYEVNTSVRPVGAGASILFVTPGGAYSNLREYYVEDDSAANQASNITAHVPKFIPKNVSKLAVSPNYDISFAYSEDTPNKLYVYKYYWRGTEKVQSAWGTWTLGDDATILGMECMENYLYLVVNRASGSYLEKVNLEEFTVTGPLSFQIHLDRLTTGSLTYIAGSDETEIGLPYEVDPSVTPTFILSGAGQVGQKVNPQTITRINDYTFRIPGNETGQVIYAGESYQMTYEFSPQFAKDKNGAILDGDLRIRNMTIHYMDTAYFKARVHPYGRSSYSETTQTHTVETEYTGKTTGAQALILGQPSFETGHLRFPVFSDAKSVRIELINDSHLGCTFTKAEWEGNLTMRSRRVG